MRPDRIEKEESVLVDVISSEGNPELNDVHLSGKTVDISEMGMRVALTITVPEKTRLGLRLEMDSDVFRLEGQVRWSLNDGQPTLGILLDKDSADYSKWAQLFELDFD